MCSVKHKNSHSVHVRTSLTPHAALLVHPVAPYTSQWTIMNLHGQINAACESRPGHPQPCHWSIWRVAFILSYKIDFSSCNMPGFGKSSHICQLYAQMKWLLHNCIESINVTGFAKTVLKGTFCILRNINSKYVTEFDKTRLTRTKTEIHFIA